MSSTATPPSTATPSSAATTGTPQPLAEGTRITSPCGKSYVIDEVLYQRPRGKRLYCLYRASSEGKQYVLKDILPGDFDYILDLQKLVEGSAHVRTLVDSIPDRHMFVYSFLDANLQLVEPAENCPCVRKDILRDALAGLADLHDKGIYHTDIKPANIMMDSFQQSDGTIRFKELLPPGSPGLTKRLSGNQFWRSPEAWARGVHNTPSDIFSFGITAIYVWLNRMAFFSDEANAADDASEMILQRHLSHFTNGVEDFGGFIEYHGGEQDPFVQRCIQLLVEFDGKKKKRRPFRRWHPVDPEFKELVSRMTCLNPLRRITAREALQHPWFRA
ncbi:kinase-like domain-containing protein [Chaetomium tenue]|uniref:Kinase-like domain-containing protein n=1 Tax=Chaetomium tenue TaxID=1854479 RepID=A0ACB7P420_9PEZI|nr:kinase-like domain-containing protein [Chaetomium globosum]